MQRLILGYCRVSTQQQSDDGHGLERYVEALKNFGIPEPFIYFDVESGVSETRKGLNEVLSQVQTGNVQMVVIPNFDRLTRSPGQWENLRELFAKYNCVLKTLEEGEIDLLSPDGKMLGRLKAAFAAQVRDRIQNHSLQGHKKHRERKEPYKAVFGYLKIDNQLRPNHDLYPESNKSYFEVARHLIEIFLEYKSLGKTASEFRKIYYCPPPSYSGKIHLKPPLSHGLKRWLENAILRGKLQYLSFGHKTPQMVVEGSHEPLISEHEWLVIKNIFEDNKARKKGVSSDNLKNPFSGIAKCINCQGLMTLKANYKRKDGSYGYALSCRRAREHDPRCSPEYANYGGVSLEQIEEIVRGELLKHAEYLVAKTLENPSKTSLVSPEAVALMETIAKLEALNDPDLKEVIQKKKTQLFLLEESQKIKTAESQERNQRFLDLINFTDEFWELMSVHSRNLLYHDLIEVIWCDRGRIDVVFYS
ncbi:resolvase domain-containing protein [Calothrix sp. NIES-4101]|nr:resolvase domain-containing protein [Calothrix sp. NIES-4101]